MGTAIKEENDLRKPPSVNGLQVYFTKQGLIAPLHDRRRPDGLHPLKHKVSFEEGKTIFNELLLLTYPDINSFETEQRYINLGTSVKDRILVLIHTERRGKIRIISCRKATARERRYYEEG